MIILLYFSKFLAIRGKVIYTFFIFITELRIEPEVKGEK